MTGGCAFVFPGQGTQRPGMGDRLRRIHPPARALFDEASDLVGFDLAALCRRGPEARLRATENAQPALFVTGCAYAGFLIDRGVQPAAVAGHSVGELCALVVAGALDFGAGVSLVRARGRLMARARVGTMVSIVGVDARAVDGMARAASRPERAELSVVAVVNGPADVVVSGHGAAVERVVGMTRPHAAALVRWLRVGGAFHSPLMAEVASDWAERVRRVPLTEPALPVALNATGALAGPVADVRRAVTEQLTAPVRWGDCVGSLAAAGVGRAVECGDSRALRRINTALGMDTVAARTPEDLVRLARQPAGVAR